MKENPHSILLVGTAGWDRADWAETYYPDDLPSDWRLAYYANDCGCVLLDPTDLARLQPQEFLDRLDDAGEHLLVLLRLGGAPLGAGWADCFTHLSGRLFLLAPPDASHEPVLPHWSLVDRGVWREPGGGRHIVCWDIDRFDLRQLKGRVSELPDEVFALIIEGPGASPAHVGELRTLLTLMGRG